MLLTHRAFTELFDNRKESIQTLDANGVVLSPILSCDTETGEIERYIVIDGKWQTDESGKVVPVKETHPAPLQFRILPAKGS